MMTIPKEILPLLASLCDGIPIGKVRPDEACPKLPKVAMVLLLDDKGGKGPAAFDSAALFNQIESVVIMTKEAFSAGASAVAARARIGDRALLVQTPLGTVAQWLALVSERRKLAHDYLLLVVDGQELPADAALMLKDISALAAETIN